MSTSPLIELSNFFWSPYEKEDSNKYFLNTVKFTGRVVTIIGGCFLTYTALTALGELTAQASFKTLHHVIISSVSGMAGIACGSILAISIIKNFANLIDSSKKSLCQAGYHIVILGSSLTLTKFIWNLLEQNAASAAASACSMGMQIGFVAVVSTSLLGLALDIAEYFNPDVRTQSELMKLSQ
jgi:hypothetical protein